MWTPFAAPVFAAVLMTFHCYFLTSLFRAAAAAARAEECRQEIAKRWFTTVARYYYVCLWASWPSLRCFSAMLQIYEAFWPRCINFLKSVAFSQFAEVVGLWQLPRRKFFILLKLGSPNHFCWLKPTLRNVTNGTFYNIKQNFSHPFQGQRVRNFTNLVTFELPQDSFLIFDAFNHSKFGVESSEIERFFFSQEKQSRNLISTSCAKRFSFFRKCFESRLSGRILRTKSISPRNRRSPRRIRAQWPAIVIQRPCHHAPRSAAISAI